MDSSRHPLAALVAAIPLPAGLVDAAGCLVLVNRAWGSCAAPGAVVQRVAGPAYFTHLEESPAEGTAELHLAAVRAVQSPGAGSGRTQVDTDLFEPEPEASCVEVGGALGGVVWSTRVAPAGDGLALVTHEDVSVRRRVQADLRKSRARLRTILTGAPLALFAVDASGVFSMVEGMAAGAAGLITPDVIGKQVDSEYRHIPDLVGAVRSAIDGATAVTTVEVGAMAFEVHCSPDLDAGGSTIGAVGVATDVTERVRAQRLKDDFVSVVNHELRTPLTSIHGALSLLENGVAGELPEEAIELTSIARTSVDRLIRMISDLLDLDRLDSGRFELNRGRFDLAELVADAARELSALATDAEVTIDHSSCLHAQVEADRDRVHQVLTNLLSNAIKFSNPGSPVTVSMSRIDGFVQVSVTDEGPGIRAEDRPRLFRKFSQLAAAGDSSRRGSGLGLVISKSIVEAHGGRISLRSEVGVGSTFSFDLPVSRVATQTQAFRAAPPKVAKRVPNKMAVDVKARTVTRKQHAPDDIGALKVMFESGHNADPRQTLRDAHATVQLLAALVGGPGGPVVQGALISLRGAIEGELDRAVRGTVGGLDELAAKAKHTYALVTAALGRES